MKKFGEFHSGLEHGNGVVEGDFRSGSQVRIVGPIFSIHDIFMITVKDWSDSLDCWAGRMDRNTLTRCNG
jgi:hypothetical protein